MIDPVTALFVLAVLTIICVTLRVLQRAWIAHLERIKITECLDEHGKMWVWKEKKDR